MVRLLLGMAVSYIRVPGRGPGYLPSSLLTGLGRQQLKYLGSCYPCRRPRWSYRLRPVPAFGESEEPGDGRSVSSSLLKTKPNPQKAQGVECARLASMAGPEVLCPSVPVVSEFQALSSCSPCLTPLHLSPSPCLEESAGTWVVGQAALGTSTFSTHVPLNT